MTAPIWVVLLPVQAKPPGQRHSALTKETVSPASAAASRGRAFQQTFSQPDALASALSTAAASGPASALAP